MGPEEFSHFLRFFFVFLRFFVFFRFSSFFFVFLRFSSFSSFFCLFSWNKGQRLQFTGKMGNFTPTPSAPTPFETSRITKSKMASVFTQMGDVCVCVCVCVRARACVSHTHNVVYESFPRDPNHRVHYIFRSVTIACSATLGINTVQIEILGAKFQILAPRCAPTTL